MKRFVVVVTVLAAVMMLGIGAWCRFAPASFAAWANWPPHAHFLRDAGVFQMGIGFMLLAALRWRDVLAVVLGGFVFTNTAHAVNHFRDLAAGGNASDPWLLLAVSGVAAVAWAARVRALRRHSTSSLRVGGSSDRWSRCGVGSPSHR